MTRKKNQQQEFLCKYALINCKGTRREGERFAKVFSKLKKEKEILRDHSQIYPNFSDKCPVYYFIFYGDINKVLIF